MMQSQTGQQAALTLEIYYTENLTVPSLKHQHRVVLLRTLTIAKRRGEHGHLAAGGRLG